MTSQEERGVLKFAEMTGAQPKTIVVAGVGHGKELPVMRRLWPEAFIIGFEPLIEMDAFSRPELDVCYVYALGTRSEPKELLTSYRPDTRATFHEHLIPLEGGGRRAVDVRTLDWTKTQSPRWHDVLLWLDTQGHEADILSNDGFCDSVRGVKWINCEVNCCSVRNGCHFDRVAGVIPLNFTMLGAHSLGSDGAEFDAVFVHDDVWDEIRHQRVQKSYDRKMQRRGVLAE